MTSGSYLLCVRIDGMACRAGALVERLVGREEVGVGRKVGRGEGADWMVVVGENLSGPAHLKPA